MRTLRGVVVLLAVAGMPAHAQAPLAVGTPQAAFAGGPIRLSPRAATMLRSHYKGDNVPLVPQPFRGQLDTALTSLDWKRAEAVKKALVQKEGPLPALMWEQTRFVATGSMGVAEMHARDVAATGSSGLFETSVMMWFYAVAVTMTDGEKCVDGAARDAHMDRLRGPEFEPVLQIVRGLADDRLAAMRELAIRMETVMAEGRTADDTMCRTGSERPEIKSDAIWRPEATAVRAMLPRHLQALASVMRPKPVTAPAQESKSQGSKPQGSKH